MTPIRHVQKRDGQLVNFEQNKISEAIWKAAQSVGGTDRGTAEKIANQVTAVLEVFFKEDGPAPNVEQIQDLVEKILIENGHAKTAKSYILYRAEHKKLRQKREEILGVERLKLSTVDGQNRQLGDFIILDIKDDLEAIFEGMKETVIIHQNGEKACVNFSALRPRGEGVKGSGSPRGDKQEASGPIGFMKLYDAALSTISNAEKKPVNHVILLNVNHPNIQEFLDYEQLNGKLDNFTLMVEVTESFMQAVEGKTDYDLINPATEKTSKFISAQLIFDQLMKNSRTNTGPKPIMIEYPRAHGARAEKSGSASFGAYGSKQRKHSSVQVNLPFGEEASDEVESKARHNAQEVTLPPIETLA